MKPYGERGWDDAKAGRAREREDAAREIQAQFDEAQDERKEIALHCDACDGPCTGWPDDNWMMFDPSHPDDFFVLTGRTLDDWPFPTPTGVA